MLARFKKFGRQGQTGNKNAADSAKWQVIWGGETFLDDILFLAILLLRCIQIWLIAAFFFQRRLHKEMMSMVSDPPEGISVDKKSLEAEDLTL